ncbi:MAG TPA: S24 family peptidase [Isosphaeraceae bacterium]|nr:S24 family peptidase [Isosphaeraceae bacterium]
MARHKNHPELVRTKCSLASRLRQVRTELFGDRGGPTVARRLGLPIRTWYNYEAGVTVPAEVLLRFVELTNVEPLWLLDGRGPKFRSQAAPTAAEDDTVSGLLRAALRRLEQARAEGPCVPAVARRAGAEPASDAVGPNGEEGATAPSWYERVRDEWRGALRDGRCVRIEGDDMAPIIADGGTVVIAAEAEGPDELDGRLVLARVEGREVVRWFRRSGRFALLRAENPAAEPGTLLLPLDGPDGPPDLRRVLWVSTPH